MTDSTADTMARQRPAGDERRLPPLAPNASLRWDVVSRILPADCGTVLEIGCGRGAVTTRITQRAQRLVAIEPDKQSFAVARANVGERAELHNCASYELPRSEKFDTVCAFEVLEHIEDDEAAIAEWRDRLVDGGLLILSVPAFRDRMAAADNLVGHFRRYDPADMIDKLEKAGFVDIDVQLYGFPCGNLLEAARNLIARRHLSGAAAELNIQDRTAGSGRLLQPSTGITGAIAGMIAHPMVWLQSRFPNRGPGLIATARIPE